MFVSFTKPPTLKQSGEAHDVQVLQIVAQCIILDIAELVLIRVWNVGLLVQSSDGIRQVGAHVVVTHLMQNCTAGVTDTFNDTMCCIIEAGLSTSAYTQLMSFSFLRAFLSAQISMRLYQTTLLVFDLELTMMNNCGFGSLVTAVHRQHFGLPPPISSLSFQVGELKRTLSPCKLSTNCG